MSQQLGLKEAERKVFSTLHSDGMWDIFLACFFLMFALAPLLSAELGDFWSVFVFIPFWGLAYLAIRWIRANVVTPRIGRVRFGQAGRAKLGRFSMAMLAFNVLAFILGIAASSSSGDALGRVFSIGFGLMLLVGFSLAALLLGVKRFYIYGLLLGLSPLAGEWLHIHHNAAHHGLPITFGVAVGTMFIVGAGFFIQLLRNNPLPVESPPFGDA